jgi:hypothetical protein
MRRQQRHIATALIALSSFCKPANALNARSSSRRRFVEASAAGVLSSTCINLDKKDPTTGAASAAPPVAQGEFETGGAQLLRAFRPKPPRLLRPRLDKDFAVLLMRASYNALDDLDCVPMDQFQRDFFLIRQGTGGSRVMKK